MLGRIPVLALLLAIVASVLGAGPAQAAPPDVTAITSSHPTIYPNIGTAKRPATSTITVASSADDVTSLEVRAPGSGAVVRTFDLTASDSASWDGRDAGGSLVPAGAYTLVALNAEGPAIVTGAVTVSLQRLVRKSVTVRLLPTKIFGKYAGSCSTLRKPSMRGWAGSYGYYANTKCRRQTWNASAVVTLHGIRVPAAEHYVDARIDTYGGAAKAKPRSRGGIEYWSDAGQKWTSFRFNGARVGWHNGATVGATALVDSERWITWRFFTAFSSRYDVAKFRVVVRYDVLSAS